ncbi:hypothetical protein PHYC_00353 [Phycisphaerales bacterium]|nr:hypothetical protein PHYC_00353 [Phycisphaerales bacterium]
MPVRHRIAASFSVLLCAHLHAQPVAWEQLDGPPGGNVGAAVFHPPSGAVLVPGLLTASYANLASAGALYRSTDAGDSWTDVTADILAASPTWSRTQCLAVDPQGRVFAGLFGAGVYRSDDAGVHWSPANAGIATQQVRTLLCDSNSIFAGAASGVYQSNNLGTSWSPINSGLTTLDVRALIAGPGYVLAATRAGGVFKRIGSGSWAAANSGLAGLNAWNFHRSASGKLFLVTDSGLYSSADDAATWQPVPGPLAGIITAHITGSGLALLVASEDGLFRSPDDGANWFPSSSGLPGSRFLGLGASDTRFFVGLNGWGLYASDDAGLTWQEHNIGIRAHTVNRLCVTDSGAILAGTQSNGIWRSPDGGLTWQPRGLFERGVWCIRQSPWGDVFAGNYTITDGQPDGHVWRSQDDGLTWSPLDNGFHASAVMGLNFGAANEVFVSSAWNPGGIHYSSNNGDSWSHLGPVPFISGYGSLRTPGGDLYFGSEGQGVWRLAAATNTWVNLGLDQSQQFAFACDSAGRVFVGNDRNIKGVWRSPGGGGAFQALAGFPGNEGYSLLAAPDDVIYAGTVLHGVQRSLDHGDTWETINTGIPYRACFALVLGPDNHLYAGAPGGVYRTTAPVLPTCDPDVNCDGALNGFDIQSTEEAVNGDYSDFCQASADLNGDGAENGFDVEFEEQRVNGAPC